jgi:hypothetical protein
MKRSNVALASLLLGLGGVFFICGIPLLGSFASFSDNDMFSSGGLFALICGPVLGYLLSLLAVILGLIGLSQTGKDKMSGRGLAIFGILLGAGPFVVLFVLFAATFLFADTIGNVFSNIISTIGPVGP